MHANMTFARTNALTSRSAPDAKGRDIAILVGAGLALIGFVTAVYFLAVAYGIDRDSLELLTVYP